MNGFLAKWQGCMEKILNQQHSAEEEKWAFLIFPRTFTSIMHACKRTNVLRGQNFILKIRMITKKMENYFSS